LDLVWAALLCGGFKYIDAVVKTETLAEKLGATTPISPLLQKANSLGLGPDELQTLAVQRGCVHYSTGEEPPTPLASERQLSNEELAIALLSMAMPYDPRSIRCGAAMLAAEGNSPSSLARLAVLESSVIPVRHVAEAGRRFEPENHFWTELIDALPDCHVPDCGALLHPTRFVAMTGFTRKGPGIVLEWQRPRPRPVTT
jgi:hypothetical protein